VDSVNRSDAQDSLCNPIYSKGCERRNHLVLRKDKTMKTLLLGKHTSPDLEELGGVLWIG
jgi:hypothetical protein